MKNDEALDIVAEYRTKHGLLGTLEALMQMESDDGLNDQQRVAWNVAMAGFGRLFDGADVGERRWIIKKVGEPLAWSNEDGWVDPSNEHADRFTTDERRRFRLPIEGMWVLVRE